MNPQMQIAVVMADAIADLAEKVKFLRLPGSECLAQAGILESSVG